MRMDRPPIGSQSDRYAAISAEWQDLYDQGLSAGAAAKLRAVSKTAAIRWAQGKGLSWVPEAATGARAEALRAMGRGGEAQARLRAERAAMAAAPAVRGGDYDDETVDAWVCRSLWRNVLIQAVWDAAGRSSGGLRVLQPHDQMAALDWFFGADAALVAQFAGIDVDVIRDRMRPFRDRMRAHLADPMRKFRTLDMAEEVLHAA